MVSRDRLNEAGRAPIASSTTPRPDAVVDADAGPNLPKRQVLIIFSGLMLGMLLAALDATIVATALPTIAGDLGGLDQLAWVVTAYLLTQTIATPLFGKLGDLYGRKRLFQIAIVHLRGRQRAVGPLACRWCSSSCSARCRASAPAG